jgi:uncharacterized protein (TIGR02145 family)
MKIFRKPFPVILFPLKTLLIVNFQLLIACALPAQNGITISDFSTNVGTDGSTLTFNVGWDKHAANMPAIWSDTAWVFADYNNAGTMTRLQLTGATLTATSAPGVGKVIKLSGNNDGVWVVGNAKAPTNTSGSFSATVQLHTAAANLSGLCVYAINYPPRGQFIDVGKIHFNGTPPFALTLEKGEHTHTVSLAREEAKVPYSVPADSIVVTYTDVSLAPGVITPATFTLQASATTYCEGAPGVSFTLSGTHRGVSYQLIKDNNMTPAATLTGTGSAATFSGTYTQGVYTAKTMKTGIYREIAGAHTVTITEHPLPTIAHLSGSTNQTKKQNEAITSIKYTTQDASSVTVSGLPSGISVAWSANTLTLSGTIYTYAVDQTYGYTITPNNHGCTNATAQGTITVTLANPTCTPPGSTVTFTAFNPCGSAATGTVWHLTDDRESNNVQTYKVKKLPDGHIWMVQDLKFGDKCAGKTTFNGSEQDAMGNITTLTDKLYYGDCRTGYTANYPFLYNWQAAINQAGAYANGPVKGCYGTSYLDPEDPVLSCQGICPNGWSIPTYQQINYLRQNALGCSGTSIGCFSSPFEAGKTGAMVFSSFCCPNRHYAWYAGERTAETVWVHIIDWEDPQADFDTPHAKSYGAALRCLMRY